MHEYSTIPTVVRESLRGQILDAVAFTSFPAAASDFLAEVFTSSGSEDWDASNVSLLLLDADAGQAAALNFRHGRCDDDGVMDVVKACDASSRSILVASSASFGDRPRFADSKGAIQWQS